ncbi:MAG: hypothetical protein ACRDLT_18625, partial [Solirubrobacteraceae bacterium]
MSGSRARFAIVAFDAAGNASPASGTLTVVAAARVKGVPKHIPGWARKLIAWERRGAHGHRPSAPRHRPPWFGAWQRAQLHPYRIAA